MVRRALVLGTIGLLVVGVVACSHVKRDELTTEVTQLREEIRAGDEGVSTEVGKVGNRVNAVEGEVADVNMRLAALEADLEAFMGDFHATILRMEGVLAFNVPVHFDFDSDVVRDIDMSVLDRFASIVDEYYPNALVTIEGFTDPAGTEAYNIDLGKRRAEAVMSYLSTARELDPARLRAVSYGETADRQVVPGARGPGDAGIENRRVALVIDYRGEHNIVGDAGGS